MLHEVEGTQRVEECHHTGVEPGRTLASRSVGRTQRRRVSAVQPSFSVIERIADWDPVAASCSRTSRTARSRTSGEYLLGRAMGSILSTNGPSRKPGRFKASWCGHHVRASTRGAPMIEPFCVVWSHRSRCAARR